MNGENTKKKSNFHRIWRNIIHNKLAVTGGIIFLLLVLMAILAPVIAPYDYHTVNPASAYLRPSLEHLFGTDQYGRDIFSRCVYGARWSLSMGISAALISMIGGVILGSVAGYFGGVIDLAIMRIIDVVQCIPNILLVICISQALGNSFFNTILAMSITGIWPVTRLIRGQTLRVRTQQYIEAATATNNPTYRIIMKHVLPSSIQPAIISTCMGIGSTIQLAASLSFIGLGIQPPLPEWGAMLTEARGFMMYYPFMLIAPGVFLTLTVFSISLLGDGLRDAMDPRLKRR